MRVLVTQQCYGDPEAYERDVCIPLDKIVYFCTFEKPDSAAHSRIILVTGQDLKVTASLTSIRAAFREDGR